LGRERALGAARGTSAHPPATTSYPKTGSTPLTRAQGPANRPAAPCMAKTSIFRHTNADGADGVDGRIPAFRRGVVQGGGYTDCPGPHLGARCRSRSCAGRSPRRNLAESGRGLSVFALAMRWRALLPGRPEGPRRFLPSVRANQYLIALAPSHAANRMPRISCRMRRNSGCGARHIVRYVSRKRSRTPDGTRPPTSALVRCDPVAKQR
jgi:hypothetical protein